MKVLIVTHGRHDCTIAIADEMAAALIDAGCDVRVADCDTQHPPTGWDAVICGGDVEDGTWTHEVNRWLQANAVVLAEQSIPLACLALYTEDPVPPEGEPGYLPPVLSDKHFPLKPFAFGRFEGWKHGHGGFVGTTTRTPGQPIQQTIDDARAWAVTTLTKRHG